jgi:copper/silver efflux system protein
VYVDVRGRDLASTVADLQAAVAQHVRLKPGMSLSYSGQFEFLERANARLKLVVPATLVIIFLLLYVTFRRFDEAALIMGTLPFALTGGIWFLYLQDYNVSVATGVGFIALAGVASEFGVVMPLYLKQAIGARLEEGRTLAPDVLDDALREGAVLRVRPKAMTVLIVAGLGQWYRIGSDESHCRAHGRRDAHGAAPVDVCDPSAVSSDAPEAPRNWCTSATIAVA